MRNYLMEFIGAMFLVMAIGLTGNPLAIGAMLMVMIYMGGHVSGAHYNPAVTLSVFLRGKLKSKEIPGYMISQVLGAFAGAAIVYYFIGKTFAPAPGTSVLFWQAVLAEALFTFALCSVVLSVATAKKMAGNYVYGLAIGFTVLASAYAVGSISGGAFNPAVALGPMLFDMFMGGALISNLGIYLIGPFAGSIAAAYVFKYLNQE